MADGWASVLVMLRSFACATLFCAAACAVDVGGLPADGGVAECVSDRDCDDSIDCTEDRCAAGACAHTTEDSRCAGDEVCVAAAGCQPAGSCEPEECAEALRDPAACQVGGCAEGGTCVGESTCAEGESCCGDGTCRACDDGNPCTEDRCEGGECVHSPLSGTPCDDGEFCNGVDECDAGVCVHGGDPCEPPTICEGARCVGCVDQSDCPEPVRPPFGECEAVDVCALSGTQSRMVTTFACVDDECVGTTAPETQACARDTDGVACGLPSASGWTVCGGFDGTCGEMGTQSQTVLSRECAAGACAEVTRTNTRDCGRDTDGIMCGATETVVSDCEVPAGADPCVRAGQRTTTTTTYACADGGCVADVSIATETCMRDTEGRSCDPSNACGGECVDGACDTDANDGDGCDDGLSCTTGDTCRSGVCRGDDDCSLLAGHCGWCAGRCDCADDGSGGACMCM